MTSLRGARWPRIGASLVPTWLTMPLIVTVPNIDDDTFVDIENEVEQQRCSLVWPGRGSAVDRCRDTMDPLKLVISVVPLCKIYAFYIIDTHVGIVKKCLVPYFFFFSFWHFQKVFILLSIIWIPFLFYFLNERLDC